MIIAILLVLIGVVLFNIELISKNALFYPLIIMLFIAQLFIIVPGSDISSASYGNFNTYKIAGFSTSTLMCMLIIFYCIFNTFIRNRFELKEKHLLLIIIIVLFDILGILTGNELDMQIEMCTKINMPFVVYFYLEYSYPKDKIQKLSQPILISNLILLIQVPLCKLLTGKFAASTFYAYIMKEEYYGYYSSPHAFAAILGVFSLWNLKCINENIHKYVNVLCLLANLLLIFLSGVRTYALAVIITIIFIFITSFGTNKLKRIKRLAVLSIVLFVIFSKTIFQYILTSRFNAAYNTVEVTSGRGSRWTIDLDYFMNQTSILKVVLGNGFQSIYTINSNLIGLNINSLNAIIDTLVDNGIMGLIMIVIIYYIMLKKENIKKNKLIYYGFFIYLSIGLFVNNILPYITVMTTIVILFRILDAENDNYEEVNSLLTCDDNRCN